MELQNEVFKSRLKLINSKDIFEKWDTVINELTMSYYPCLKEREAKVLNCIIHVIWDVGFSDAIYIEVMIRLMFTKQLFPTRKLIRYTIKELCEKKILRCKVEKFETINPDGTVLSTDSHKVLAIANELRIEAINAMAEVFQSYMNSFFSPRSKYNKS